MKIDIQEILRLKEKSMSLQETYELPQLTHRNKQLLKAGTVHFEGQGEMHAGLFTVKGKLTGSYTLACSRCLADLPVDFALDFEERFNIDSKVVNTEEEDEIHEVEGNQIDLLPFIEEEVLVSIPFKPLCESKEECQKNVPQEGKDWTLLSSENEEKRIDPRLADLAKFFDKDKNE